MKPVKFLAKQTVRPFTHLLDAAFRLKDTTIRAKSDITHALDEIKKKPTPHTDHFLTLTAEQKFQHLKSKNGISNAEVKRRIKECKLKQTLFMLLTFFTYALIFMIAKTENPIPWKLLACFVTTVPLVALTAGWLHATLNKVQLQTRAIINIKELMSRNDFFKKLLLPHL